MRSAHEAEEARYGHIQLCRAAQTIGHLHNEFLELHGVVHMIDGRLLVVHAAHTQRITAGCHDLLDGVNLLSLE